MSRILPVHSQGDPPKLILSHGEAQEGDDALPVTFELSDTLYAKADIKPQSAKEVYLWLGVRAALLLAVCLMPSVR